MKLMEKERAKMAINKQDIFEALGIDTETGVVRASFVHYNTMEEIERLCAALEEIL